MTTKLFTLCVAALALGASACAQTTHSAQSSFRQQQGRAAQPGSWTGQHQTAHVVSTGEQRGQAAEPEAWPATASVTSASSTPHVYASVGTPRGQAAQPSAWSRAH